MGRRFSREPDPRAVRVIHSTELIPLHNLADCPSQLTGRVNAPLTP